MFKAIKEFFVGKPKVEEAPAQCPYKAEAPAPEPAPAPVIEQTSVPVAEPAVVTVTVPEPTPVADTVIVAEQPTIQTVPVPVVEEINITTVTLNDQITDAITVTAKSDTVPTGVWPFPVGAPPEPEVKKKRTFVKREEPVTEKKPTPAIKVNKNKPRKKK